MALTLAERESGHRFERHENCERQNCMICEGGLALCTICGALEGALLPQCPGRRLSQEEHDQNYKHYCEGTGPFQRS